jgi:hypothetical protein
MSRCKLPIGNRKAKIVSFSMPYAMCVMPDSILKRSILYLFLSSFWIISPALAQDKLTIPCEVMEVSPPFQSSSTNLSGTRYILLHHAHSEDRETISRWLKAYSGTEVTFIVNKREYKGILFRLGHCFGRGLLLYADDVRPGRRDIVKLILSPPP